MDAEPRIAGPFVALKISGRPRCVRSIRRETPELGKFHGSLAGLHTAPGPGIGWAFPRAVSATPLSPALPAGRPRTALSMFR